MDAELLVLRTLRVEALKDVELAPFRDARSFVEDLRHHRPVLGPRFECNPATGRAERQRVGDEVSKHLHEPTFDPVDHQIPFPVRVEHQQGMVLGGGRLRHVDQRRQHLPDVHGAGILA
jgi:hypothetical protein